MLNLTREPKLAASDEINIKSVLITQLKSDVISEHEASANGRGVKVLTSALNMPLAADSFIVPL